MKKITLNTLTLSTLARDVHDLKKEIREIAKIAYSYQKRDEVGVRFRIRESITTLNSHICGVANASNAIIATTQAAQFEEYDDYNSSNLAVLIPASHMIREIANDAASIAKCKSLIDEATSEGVEPALFAGFFATSNTISYTMSLVENYVDVISNQVDEGLSGISSALKNTEDDIIKLTSKVNTLTTDVKIIRNDFYSDKDTKAE